MKKQLIALAALTALCGAATAADVQLYGAVDTGFNWGKVSHEANTFKMNSGILGSSKWGMKGSEDLGNGYGISFRLESAFSSDTGEGNSKRLFHREARLTAETPYGEISFGRMGALTSSAGYYELNYAFEIYDGGWGVTNDTMGGSMFFSPGRCDNMITYATPKAAGFSFYLQHSLQNDSTGSGTEGKSDTDRYSGIGMTYENGPLTAVAVFDGTNRANVKTPRDHANTRTLTLGGNYDFGVMRVYAFAQYGKNETSIGGKDFDDELIDGYTAHVGTAVPAFGGTAKLAVYYASGEGVKESKNKIKAYNVAASFEYPLSKRTTAYAGAGYLHQKKDLAGAVTKTKNYDVAIGLNHAF